MDIAIVSLIYKILIDLQSGSIVATYEKGIKIGTRGVQIADTNSVTTKSVRVQKCVGWLFHYMMTHLPAFTSVDQAEGENDQGL